MSFISLSDLANTQSIGRGNTPYLSPADMGQADALVAAATNAATAVASSAVAPPPPPPPALPAPAPAAGVMDFVSNNKALVGAGVVGVGLLAAWFGGMFGEKH